MRSYLYVYKIKKEESSDIFLRICHSIENTLHPSFIENEIVDFDQSRIQRYIFPDNRILPVSYTHLTLPTTSRV